MCVFMIHHFIQQHTSKVFLHCKQVEREHTNVLNVEQNLIVEDSLIAGAELDCVTCPDGGVVLVEEALVRRVGAVVRALDPFGGGHVSDSAVTDRSQRNHRIRSSAVDSF